MKSIVLTILFTLLFSASIRALDSNPYDQSLYTPDELKQNELRVQLGLPPNPPLALLQKKRIGLNGAQAVMKPDSLASKFANKGHIAVHEAGVEPGSLLGYLACYKVVKSKKDATLYAFNIDGPLMEITSLASNERLAIISGQMGSNLAKLSPNFHLARHTRFSSPAGSIMQQDTEKSFMYESNVFSYNPDEDEIQAQWVNTDGAYVDVEIAVMDDRIYYTGDVNAFRTYANNTVQHVMFKWYQIPNQ